MSAKDWIDLLLDLYGKVVATIALIISIKSLGDKAKTAPKKPLKQKRKR